MALRLIDLLFWRRNKNRKRKAVPKGFALCIGLNAVSPDHYGGWSGELAACENDARSMAHMLKNRGYATKTLLTREATVEAVTECVRLLAEQAVSGDIVVVTNSSHGGQLKDADGNEADGLDETTCLYNRQFVDDEWAALFCLFRAGVRVLFISDSCHSGTVSRAFGQPPTGCKAMPRDINYRVNTENAWIYKTVAEQTRKLVAQPKAAVLALGACADNQYAMDGLVNGAFTAAMLAVLRRNPDVTYGELIRLIGTILPPSQSPKYTYSGFRDKFFESEPAFTIAL